MAAVCIGLARDEALLHRMWDSASSKGLTWKGATREQFVAFIRVGWYAIAAMAGVIALVALVGLIL